MAGLSPEDPGYSPVIDARQSFYALEKELPAARPLTPEAWEQVVGRNPQLTTPGVARAAALRDAGYPEQAEQLMREWSRLLSSYRAEAHGESARGTGPGEHGD